MPGKLSDVEKVIVDIGTGYYVEKVEYIHGIPILDHLLTQMQTLDSATKFYAEKENYVKKNLEQLQETINNKQSSLRGRNVLRLSTCKISA